MLQPIFEAIEKLISDFSIRRVSFWLILIGIIFSSLYIYEIKTAHFELKKLELSLNILKNIDAVETKNQQYAEAIKTNILISLKNITKLTASSAYDFEIPITVKKGFLTALPWFIMAMFTIPGIKNGEKKSANAFLGMTLIGVFFGGIGALIPNVSNLDFNYIYFPIGHTILTIIGILVWQAKKSNK